MSAVPLDLSFLEVTPRPQSTPSRPVNVYDILREGWRETRVDMTLQFFLDPGERHGLGSLVIDALMRTLDGANVITAAGVQEAKFAAASCAGSSDWEIGTQVDFIDVYAINREHRMAVVLENKITHEFHNPLDRYAKSALANPDIDYAVVAVLAPERRNAPLGLERWLSRAITYSDLAEEIKRSPGFVEHLMDPGGRDERRSLDLLQQFIEARTGDSTVTDLVREAELIGEWRTLLDEHAVALANFDNSRASVARLLRDRNRRLQDILAGRFDDAGLKTTWEAHGGSKGVDYWNAYCFTPQNWSIELKMSTLPDLPGPIYVFDYQGRTYKPARVENLGVEWSASDEEIADAFVARVHKILESVEAASTSA